MNFEVDFYADDEAGGILARQGRTYLKTRNLQTGESGRIFFRESILGEHHNMSATATDPDGNTSEFGRDPLVHSIEFTQAVQVWQPLDKLLLNLKPPASRPYR